MKYGEQVAKTTFHTTTICFGLCHGVFVCVHNFDLYYLDVLHYILLQSSIPTKHAGVLLTLPHPQPLLEP